jgi:hypothetical protein
MKYKKFIPFAKEQLGNGISPEDCIPKLKELGVSQRDTVLVLKKVFKMTIGEADELVLFSSCWKEKLETNIEFRNAFGDALENYSEEE